MKVTILGKYVSKTGIESLLVATVSKDAANSMARKASELGATIEQIKKMITEKEFEGEPSYSFFTNCSNFTFEKVQPFGILDCEFKCFMSKNGFLGIRIDKVGYDEIVHSYTKPTGGGWTCGEAPEIQKQVELVAPQPLSELANIESDGDEILPF